MVKKVVGEFSSEHPIISKKIDKSLSLSIKEGGVASVSSSTSLSYFSPFILAMNATASQVGVLYALTNLLPSIVQLKAPSLIEKFSRKKIVTTIISLRLLLWIPIFLSAILFYFGVPYMVWTTILFIGLSYGIMAIGYPVWFSWIGALVPEGKRGNYFSKRNRVVSFVGILTLVFGAILLDYFKKLGVRLGDPVGFTLLGFGILFLFAIISRIWSLKLLRKHYEPRLKLRKKDGFSFKSFIRRAPETPFGRFSIFRGFFSIALGISGPFWAVYILRNLGFSYVWFISILVSGILFQMIFLPVLGKFSDRFGNVKLMKLCAILISLNPLLWFFSSMIPSPLMVKAYLLFVPSLIGGFGWAGYNLATNNYIYDSVGPRKRCFGTSYLNLIVGIGTFIGAGIGSLIVLFDFQIMEPILIIFLLSWILRTLVVVFGLKYLREVRHVGKFSSQFFIREFEPMRGAVREVHHLNNMGKKVEHYI
jgi:MFS family permease